MVNEYHYSTLSASLIQNAPLMDDPLPDFHCEEPSKKVNSL